MYYLQPKEYYRSMFYGSDRLFNACWSRFLDSRANYDDDKDVINYLDAIAVELVNDSGSDFYLHGE